MELIGHDDETVTLRLKREEYAQIYGLVISAHTQYEKMDPVELELDEDDLMRLLMQFRGISRGLGSAAGEGAA